MTKLDAVTQELAAKGHINPDAKHNTFGQDLLHALKTIGLDVENVLLLPVEAVEAVKDIAKGDNPFN